MELASMLAGEEFSDHPQSVSRPIGAFLRLYNDALDEDRRRAAQTKADTEYLARELAALRLAVGEVVTREYLRHELEDLRSMLTGLLPEGADGEAAGASDDWERIAKKSR